MALSSSFTACQSATKNPFTLLRGTPIVFVSAPRHQWHARCSGVRYSRHCTLCHTGNEVRICVLFQQTTIVKHQHLTENIRTLDRSCRSCGKRSPPPSTMRPGTRNLQGSSHSRRHLPKVRPYGRSKDSLSRTSRDGKRRLVLSAPACPGLPHCVAPVSSGVSVPSTSHHVPLPPLILDNRTLVATPRRLSPAGPP